MARRGWPASRAPISAVEGMGELTKAVARGGIPIWSPVADTGAGEARTVTSENGEEGLLLQRGLRDGLRLR